MGKNDFQTATKAVSTAETTRRNLNSNTLLLAGSMERGQEVYDADPEHAKLVLSLEKVQADFLKRDQEARLAVSVLATATALKIENVQFYL